MCIGRAAMAARRWSRRQGGQAHGQEPQPSDGGIGETAEQAGRVSHQPAVFD